MEADRVESRDAIDGAHGAHVVGFCAGATAASASQRQQLCRAVMALYGPNGRVTTRPSRQIDGRGQGQSNGPRQRAVVRFLNGCRVSRIDSHANDGPSDWIEPDPKPASRGIRFYDDTVDDNKLGGSLSDCAPPHRSS